MFIYKITNIINKKCYIGQTTKSIDVRWSQHKNDLLSSRHANIHLQNAVLKYGIENFTFDVIDTATTIEELNIKEIYWIGVYNSLLEGYNIRPGGNNSPLSNTTKEKISEKLSGRPAWNKGMTLSIKTRQKMSESRKGKSPWNFGTRGLFTRTDDTKEKLRKSKLGDKNPMFGKIPKNKGVKLSLEERNKMSKTWKFCDPTGKIIEFTNLNKFCEDNNLNISHMHNVYTGKRNHHKNWTRVE